jgi:thymidylate synthase (FAD)
MAMMEETLDTLVILEPSVRLVGRLTIDEGELSAFLEDEGVESWKTDTDLAAQKLVEVAGRLCYKSYAKPRPGGNASYLGHILEVGHGSVIEHAVYNFIITGVSRSFTHELVRHRAGWAYSQRSQRFVDEKDCAFVEPGPIAADPELHAIWLDAVKAAHLAYARLAEGLMSKFADVEDRTLRRKKAREAARSVLPNATETQIFVTANARALRHFIEARADESADAEIRKVAIAMLKILQVESPNLFGDYALVDLPGGGQSASTPHRKV